MFTVYSSSGPTGYAADMYPSNFVQLTQILEMIAVYYSN